MTNLQPFAAARDTSLLQDVERTIEPAAPHPARQRFDPALALRFELAAASGNTFTRFDVERVLGSNDLLGVDYLSRGLAAARPVARLILAGGAGYATGFLVAPRLLMTNRHVFESADQARGALAEFGYELSFDRNATKSETFRLDPDTFFIAGPAQDEQLLDYAIIALDPRSETGGDLSRWGYIRMDDRPGKIMESEFVTIIQHPSGAHKQVALRENELIRREDARPVLAYKSDTAPGSSGAPCFNDQWQLVALHSRGVPKTDEQGRVELRTGQVFSREELKRIPGLRDTDIVWVENLGIRVSRIVAHLRTEVEAVRKGGAEPNPLLVGMLEDISRGGPSVEGGVPTPDHAALREARMQPTFEAAERATRRARRPVSSGMTATGYDPNFLRGHIIPLPIIGPGAKRFGAPARNRQTDGVEFTYTHFSTIHCADRMLAFVTAVNIDGRKSVPLERGRDKWSYDDRLPEDMQAGDWLYKEEDRNFFDRGHLVRRLDPCWGTPNVVQQANDDTFYWTNCSPQHWSFNQGAHLWQGLENYILDNADSDNLLVSVFNGPIFRSDDYMHRGVGIPRDYFKVVAVVKRDGSLAASAYTVSQAVLVENIDFEELPIGRFRTFQRSIARLEAMTGLDFGDALRSADVFGKGKIEDTESMGQSLDAVELRRLGDIRL